MRRALIALILVAATATFAARQMISVGGEVPLYANQKRAVNEAAVYTASSSETFAEIKSAGNMIQLRTKDGRELWTEKRLVKEYSQAQGSSMDLGSGKIEGYLDNPQAVYILQEDANALGGIQLDRSFVEAIQGNMDREQVESRNGENN